MYHVTITDLDDGRVVTDLDTRMMTGVIYDDEKEGVRGVSFANGVNALEQLELVLAMQKMIDELFDRNPDVKILHAFKDLFINGATVVDLSAIERMKDMLGGGDE